MKNLLRSAPRAAAALAFSALCPLLTAQSTFTNLPIGGGGYVTGLVVHPQNGSVAYARTDVGGAYLYNPTTQGWTQLLAQQLDSNQLSCDGMGVDPSDTTLQKVYAFVGNGGAAILLYSSNQGGSWTNTDFPTSITGHGNWDYRWAGDRIAIDPNKAGRILVGTRANGLWCNNVVNGTPNSANWSQYSAVPVGTGTGKSSEAVGVTFVAYYKGSGTNSSGYTNTVYVGVSGQGVYHTTNGGTTWGAMSGSPSYPVQGRVDSSGNLYVTAGNANAGSSYGGVFKYSSGTWSTITPSTGKEYSGLSINPSNASDILVAVGNASPCAIYYSTNAGSSWSANKAANENNTVTWQPAGWFTDHMSYVLFAPTTSNPNQAWFGDWYDVWSTPDVTASSPTWTNYERGFEESYTLGFRTNSPTGSGAARAFYGSEDIDGMTVPDISTWPTTEYTGMNDTTSIDVCETNNQYVYRTGDIENTSGKGYYSTDNGSTWTQFGSLPSTTTPQGGRIAVAANTTGLIVWLPLAGTSASPIATVPYYSTNSGSSWTAGTGIPSENWATNDYYAAQTLASNKGSTNRFYIYHPKWGFYQSNTGSTAGASWTAVGTGLPSSSSLTGYTMFGTKSVPGQNGGVWVSVAGSGSAFGLYSSTNYGSNFTKVNSIVSATAVAFGAVMAGSSQPATVYCLGQVSGDTNDWVYESDDLGSTWTRLNSSAAVLGPNLKVMEADRNVYEVVYVGTSGMGAFTNASFVDSFQSGIAPDWTVDSGSWSVVNGGSSEVYKVTGSGDSHAGQPNWTDYSVEADITPTSLSGGQDLQLAARYADPGDNYMVLLYPKAVDIVKNMGGVSTVLKSVGYTISNNTTYDVQFVLIGTTLQAYVNGSLVASATDSSFASGRIAVGSYNATGEFDNVVARPQ